MSAFYNEWEPYAAQWTRNLIEAGHVAPGVVDERSIRDLVADDVRGFTQVHLFSGIAIWSHALRLAGWPDDLEVWTASCPCQPFSQAGRRKGVDDERHLWPEAFRLIKERRPVCIYCEQISSPDGLAWFDAVRVDLEGADYTVGVLDTCSASVGAPNQRQRLYFVALANGERLEGLRVQLRERATRSPLLGELANASGDERRSRRSEQEDRARSEQLAGRGDVGGSAGGMGDASSERGWGYARAVSLAQDARERARITTGDLADESFAPGAVGGFWAGADWLYCRDDKWRPVMPQHVEMVDGDTEGLGRGSTNVEAQASGSSAPAMQAMRREHAEEEIQQRGTGEHPALQAEKVLRSAVHGAPPRGRNQESDTEERKTPVGQNSQERVRTLSADEDTDPAIRASRGRESTQQRPVELEDVVRLLPSSLALSVLQGDSRTESGLRVLLGAIYQEGYVQHASDSSEAFWASVSQEAKNRVAVGFDASRWRIVDPIPLVVGAENRVGKLRAYGNSLNGQVAAYFVRAVIDYLIDEHEDA